MEIYVKEDENYDVAVTWFMQVLTFPISYIPISIHIVTRKLFAVANSPSSVYISLKAKVKGYIIVMRSVIIHINYL
jgi:hypothetical protein